MSLLGIDVGTTACKAVAFTETGEILGSGYREYESLSRIAGRAELDPVGAVETIKSVIRSAVSETRRDPVTALAVSSFGEAVVPISAEGKPLGPSLLATDVRGEGYVAELTAGTSNRRVHEINGNTWANQYTVTKLMWLQRNKPELYRETETFLLWAGFVSYALGADPVVDYTLANRTLLFDLSHEEWSDELLRTAGLDGSKLPRIVAPGTPIGTVSPAIASEVGLPPNVTIVAGVHDQCANALGCGAIRTGDAMFGMGTYLVIVPMFERPAQSDSLYELGLNVEHAAVPGLFLSLIYNMSGAIVRWFRDTFAGSEHRELSRIGKDVYDRLFSELPEDVSPVTVLPHFSAMGPPDYIDDATGAFAGLSLDTSRGEILKGILQGAAFSLRECVDTLPGTGLGIKEYRAVGGGSKADSWVQLNADILGRPILRPEITEAGAFGSAILAGVATGVYDGIGEAVSNAVRIERVFEPDLTRRLSYDLAYDRYREMWSRMGDFLRRGDGNDIGG